MKLIYICFLCISCWITGYSQQGSSLESRMLTLSEADSIVKLWKKSEGTVVALRVTPADFTLRQSDSTTMTLRLYACKAGNIDANLIMANPLQLSERNGDTYFISHLKKSKEMLFLRWYPKDVQPDYRAVAVVPASLDPVVVSIVPANTEIKNGEAIHAYKVKGLSAGETSLFFHVKVKDLKGGILFEQPLSTSVVVDY